VSAAVAGDVRGAAPVLGILFGVAAAAIVGRSAGSNRDLLLDGLLLIGVAVALLGWAGVVWRIDPLGLVEQGVYRAASTLTYENAAAALLAPLALVALARAAARPERTVDRLVATALIVGVGATLSRAGWLGLGVGLVVVAVCIPWRRLLPVAVPVLAGAAVATAGVIAVSPAATHRPAVVPVLALGAGAWICVARGAWTRRRVAAAAPAGVGMLLAAGAVLGHAATSVSSARRTSASPDRDNEWRATARVVRRHPLVGVGPTHLIVRWVDSQGQATDARFTHNEYLQLAAEQGVVAPLLVIAGLGVVALALARRTIRDRADWLAAGALAGLAAFAVHSAFDFMWHVPVVPIVVAALVGAALAPRAAAQS